MALPRCLGLARIIRCLQAASIAGNGHARSVAMREEAAMTIVYTLQIAAPIERVFDCVEDEQKILQWMEGVESITYPGGVKPPVPVGTRSTVAIREGGRVNNYDSTVIAYDKPRHLAVHLSNASFTTEVHYRLTPENDGTRLDHTCDIVNPSLIARILMALFGWIAKAMLKKHMMRLKALAESNAA